MAVIGHAEIVVRAITNNFERELKDTLKNVSKSISVGAGQRIGDGFADGFNRSNASSIFGKLSDGLRSMVPQAEAARERFQSLVRVGYVLQSVLGLLAGGISSVVVSIGPLIGSLLRAAPAALVLANAFVTLRVAMAVGRTAFGNIFQAVKQATEVNGGYSKSLKDIREEWQQLLFDAEAAAYSEEEAALNLEKALNNLRRMADLPPNSMARREAQVEYEKAELAYRRAKDRTKDLNETVQEGFDSFRDAQKNAGGAGTDPLAQLNAAQKEFARRLIELNPKLDKLKLKMSEAFLSPLYASVDFFEDRLLPILDKRLPQIAGQVGDAINQIIGGIDTSTLDSVFAKMVTPFEEGGRSNLQLFGDILDTILKLFLKIIDGTGKPLNDILTNISDSLGKFTEGLSVKKIEEFFTSAVEEARKWKVVLKNVFDGFGNLINLTTGPGSAGEYMLEWFTEASAGFKNMFADDPEAGKQFFKDAMVNARSVLSSIGELIKQILGVADNPNIAVAFDKLKEGAPSIGEMLDKMIDAAPSFAEFIVELVDTLNALTDSDQVSAFFETLTTGLKSVNDFLKSPIGQKLLDNLGPVLATLSAVGLAFDALKFAFQVFVGYIAFTLGFFDKPIGMIKKGFGVIRGLFSSPLKGGLLAILILMVAKTIEFYNKFEDFRIMVDNVAAGIGTAFGNLGTSLGGLFDALMGDSGLGGLIAMFDPMIKKLLEVVIPFIGGVVEFAINAVASAVDFITSLVKSIMDVVGGVIDGVKRIFEGDFLGGLLQIAISAINIIVGVVQGILNGIITGVNLFIDFINGIISSIANSPAAQQLGFKPTTIGKIKLLDLTGAVARGLAGALNNASTSRSNAASSGGETSRFTRLAPRMADGGIAYPTPGGTLVTVAEAGRPERIEPLNANGLSDRDIALINQMGGGPKVSITVNPSPGMDEKELAAAVSRQLAFEIRKGTI